MLKTILTVIIQVADILIIAYAIYRILLLMKDSSAIRLLKGILILIGCYIVSGWLQLETVHWLLGQSWTIILIAIAIIFQPELRRGLERLGTTGNWRSTVRSYSHYDEIIGAVRRSAMALSRTHTGMLLVIEGKNPLQAQINTGIPIDARITSELLLNLFYTHAPLHDGAVILRGTRIAAAGCIMPLSKNEDIESRLGTRHRAGLGTSEASDAFVVIVSEETGAVSVALNGKLYENISEKKLDTALRQFYQLDEIRSRRGASREAASHENEN